MSYLASSSASDDFRAFDLVEVADGMLELLDSNAFFRGAPAYLTAHSRATRSNFCGSFISMWATSASWGSFGSGVLRRDCSESRADLIVKTGDHADPRVSRQIAP